MLILNKEKIIDKNKKYQVISTNELELIPEKNYFVKKEDNFKVNLLDLNTNEIVVHDFLKNEDDNQEQEYLINEKRFADIPFKYIFNNLYIEISNIVLPSKEKALILKRQELSLVDYDKECNLENLKKHYFYDVLFFINDKFYIFYNHLENTYENIQEFNNLSSIIKVYKNQIEKYNLHTKDYFDADNFSYPKFNPTYDFEYGQMFFKKEKESVNRRKIKNIVKNNNIKNKQYFKLFKQEISSNRVTDKYDKSYIFSRRNKKKYTLYLAYFFDLSTIFKEFIFDVLNVPNSQREIKDLHEIILYYKYPVLENVWHSYLTEDFLNNYSVYEVLNNSLEKQISFNEYYDKYFFENKNNLSKDYYENVSNKQLQKDFLIYSKQINKLLKEKFVFINQFKGNEFKSLNNFDIYKENVNSFLNIYPAIFIEMFENHDNLQNFIKILPEKIYTSKSMSDIFNEMTVYLPLKYINKSDYLKFNIGYLNEDDLAKKLTNSQIEKRMNRYVKKLTKDEKDVENGFIRLTGKTTKELLVNTVFTQESLELSIIKYYEKTFELRRSNVNQENYGRQSLLTNVFDEMQYHFEDLISIFYEIHYVYENKKYKAKYKKQFDNFFEKTFYSIDSFEKELYVLKNYLDEDILQEKIPSKNYTYLTYDEYYFKQPSDGFELKFVGNEMHHCVFSYFNDLKKLNPKIFVVVLYDKENNPIVCLEINKDENGKEFCSQAKMSYNNPVFKNDLLNDFVLDFCLQNNIHIKSMDINNK